MQVGEGWLLTVEYAGQVDLEPAERWRQCQAERASIEAGAKIDHLTYMVRVDLHDLVEPATPDRQIPVLAAGCKL
jgi:hypothetical protein